MCRSGVNFRWVATHTFFCSPNNRKKNISRSLWPAKSCGWVVSKRFLATQFWSWVNCSCWEFWTILTQMGHQAVPVLMRPIEFKDPSYNRRFDYIYIYILLYICMYAADFDRYWGFCGKHGYTNCWSLEDRWNLASGAPKTWVVFRWHATMYYAPFCYCVPTGSVQRPTKPCLTGKLWQQSERMLRIWFCPCRIRPHQERRKVALQCSSYCGCSMVLICIVVLKFSMYMYSYITVC